MTIEGGNDVSYTKENLAKMMDDIAVYGEMMGGLRRQLVEQHGFADDIAQQMILEMLRQAKPGSTETES
jgi:polyhydroxyalkanoate synthesis regulator phasin